MAGRCSLLLPLARLLLLAVVLVAALHGEGAVATRPLLGIAEPPASPADVAAGPGDAAQAGAGGGRPDPSEAGGEVILAGFAAAVIIVVFCYIRVTREKNSSGGGGVGAGEKQESLGAF